VTGDSPITVKPTKPDPIATAEQALRLEREALSALTQRRAKIDADVILYSSAERDQTARPSDFADHQRRLAAVRLQLGALREDERALSDEISTQRAKVATSEAILRLHQSLKGARRVRELLPELSLYGKRLDEAVQVLVSTYGAAQETLRAIRMMSGNDITDEYGRPLDPTPAPSDRVVAVRMRNALIASLTETDLEVERLPPHARRSFSQLVAAWTMGIERWADQRLPQDREAA
jgi:hypothetical protein